MASWQLMVPITTLFALVMNALANLLPIAGRTTAEISDSYPALFTPAGYVFSIWGVIYTLLLGYSLFQALPGQRANPRLRALATPIAISSVANGVWIVLWHHLWLGTSVLVILTLLVSLIVAYLRLRHQRAAALGRPAPPSRAERFWAFGLLSIYLGWASVATVANISVYLYGAGFERSFLALPDQFWGVVVIIVATTLGVLMLRHQRDLAYAGVLVWALVGIVVAQSAALFVASAAVIAVVALLLAAVQSLASARALAR